jgi:hypothetical protein
MKKLIVMFFLASIVLVVNAQNLFKPVTLFPTQSEKVKLVKVGELVPTHKLLWRFDATMIIAEVNRNKVTKEWASTSFSAVGPAIGIQNYIPKSEIDPTPINNYGASIGLAIGKTIYDPQFAEAKIVLAVNIWQYFKFGSTYTFNPPTDIAKLGFFFGGGITF